VAMGTLNVAALTVVPWMVTCPVTDWLRPTAVVLWPSSTSFTRYPTVEPEPTVHVPATEVVVVVAGEPPPDVAEAVGELRLSAAGALPLKK
jgi:hypothetical protein